MTAQFFPTVEQIFDILIGEMPEGVYADDRADDPDHTKRSISSSEIRTASQMYANLYSNLSDIYADKFISTVTPDGLGRWELDLFAAPQDPLLTYAQRQANLFTQFRSTGALNFAAINQIVHGVLDPAGLTFKLIQWNGCGVNSGAWILDETPLDVSTWLAARDPLVGAGRGMGITPLDCSLNYAAAGITAQDLADIQTTAYTYEVLIFGIADGPTLDRLDARLTKKEPARSTHVITNNAHPIGWISPYTLDGGDLAEDIDSDEDFGDFEHPPTGDEIFDGGGF